MIPKQAYTLVDGKAIGPGNRTIKLDLGTHHVIVANHGHHFVGSPAVSGSSDSQQMLDRNLLVTFCNENSRSVC